MGTLVLDDLRAGIGGVTPGIGGALAEAAIVCLTSCSHRPGVGLRLSGRLSITCPVDWTPPVGPVVANWADDDEATEYGACGIALRLVHVELGLELAQRSRKGTGFDYWLAPSGTGSGLFQGMTRLEVSGIRHGTTSAVNARLKRKIEQVSSHQSALPSAIVVVEFSTPRSKVA